MRGTFAVLLLSCAGCQTSTTDGLVASSAPPEISGSAASAIAGDMVTKFAEQIGPANGTIILKPDSSPFGQALETSLKGWGYAVATDQQTDGQKEIPLAYVVDSHEGQILVRMSTSTVELGRAYQTTLSGASPASPLSVMRRG
ncbi:conjugal transfer protein TrbH [Aminobacter anthyllidis]|uniref:Conjugal transfer protein TrbH n=1 Tax=Aminobacter anthyllidis TaxID=1035067 RepID=A0A9X1D7P5_9HYPH|nr:conjugal transfer protein TrbH [Aminobacter anthyllidis]MBT1160155.1 conjugal transfer protein TrbH [Aminobacter anthyllidis]